MAGQHGLQQNAAATPPQRPGRQPATLRQCPGRPNADRSAVWIQKFALLPRVVSFRCRAESLQQQRKSRFTPAVFALALAATLMSAIAALISSRWASKGGVNSPSSASPVAVFVVIIVQDRMAVGYHAYLGEFSLPKDKRGL